MAINVRLPDELDARLALVAEQLHVSKNTLLVQGAELVIARSQRAIQVDTVLDQILESDADLLRRLEDA
jgi:predicted transcriptional regulator